MASGQTLARWSALHGTPPASNPATFNTRNAHPVLEFDTTTSEAVYFEGVLPRNYAGGGVTIALHWLAASATSGSVVWGASMERHDEASLDLDADSFAAEVLSAASGAPGTTGMLRIASIALTNGAQMDNLAAGESFRLQIARKPADAGDDMAGDAQLLKVEMRET